ncbi:hypothetical protein KKC22_14770, partial [Myxococcota bacterium]|nr:hypothetical protein [Myxococcota bacterium]
MKTIVLCIIMALLASSACGKKEKKKVPDKTPAPVAAKVTVASLAQLITAGQTAEFVKQLEQLTAILVND